MRRNTIDVVPARAKSAAAPDCTAAILLASFLGSSPAGSNDKLVRKNHLRGSGQYDIVVLGDATVSSEGNTFVGNQLAGFAASEVDVLLNEFANFNTFNGAVGAVIDAGSGNTIFGAGGP